MTSTLHPKILFVSGREVSYIRNRVLLTALRAHHDVRVLTPRLRGTPVRIAAGLARYMIQPAGHDVVFAGFYGQPLALALSRLQREPIVLDAFVSTYDTLCNDRRRFRPDSLAGRAAFRLDVEGCRVARRVLTDTEGAAQYFRDTFGVPGDKLAPVYVGCDESIFFPRPSAAEKAGCEVFYYGAFLPLHGVEVILRAAEVLKRKPAIHITVGGDGPGLRQMRQLAVDLTLRNVDFIGWIPIEQLPAHIAGADICLGGHFSTIPKAGRVIATKTFQFLAMRKPTIVGDNAATRELFRPGEDVLAVPMGNPSALANAIQMLAEDAALRSCIATGGRACFEARASTSVIAQQLVELMGGL
jgi:glycosyltransferase involved in cell wall biosynthesis